ncbi:hypothetical protein RRG08_055120 [Elysia crispata]|uniref:Uncharacterized protein n=1 Tax=Elysia crispata TaxID=231223 RepID=A0AAE1AL61_9GAST|nr:hypothetical protein RRG08_055120 [Elysia crispata]
MGDLSLSCWRPVESSLSITSGRFGSINFQSTLQVFSGQLKVIGPRRGLLLARATTVGNRSADQSFCSIPFLSSVTTHTLTRSLAPSMFADPALTRRQTFRGKGAQLVPSSNAKVADPNCFIRRSHTYGQQKISDQDRYLLCLAPSFCRLA